MAVTANGGAHTSGTAGPFALLGCGLRIKGELGGESREVERTSGDGPLAEVGLGCASWRAAAKEKRRGGCRLL
jgi:hypothetical protein